MKWRRTQESINHTVRFFVILICTLFFGLKRFDPSANFNLNFFFFKSILLSVQGLVRESGTRFKLAFYYLSLFFLLALTTSNNYIIQRLRSSSNAHVNDNFNMVETLDSESVEVTMNGKVKFNPSIGKVMFSPSLE